MARRISIYVKGKMFLSRQHFSPEGEGRIFKQTRANLR